MKTLILTYSVIAVFIMNLTYIARVNPELPCGILFDEREWEVLYCAGNRRKAASGLSATITPHGATAPGGVIPLLSLAQIFVS